MGPMAGLVGASIAGSVLGMLSGGGGGDTTSTQTTTLPPPTPDERAMMDLIKNDLFPQMMSELGYEVTSTSSKIEDDPGYKAIQAKIRTGGTDLSQPPPGYLEGRWGRGGNTRNPPWEALSEGERKQYYLDFGQPISSGLTQEQIDQELAVYRAGWKPTVSYDSRKIGSPEEESAREAYFKKYPNRKGWSQEKLDKNKEYYETVGKAKRDVENKEKKKEAKKESITEAFINSVEKWLKGDFEPTEEQKAWVEKNNAPVAAALDKMFADARAEAGKSAEDLKKEVGVSEEKIGKEISATETAVGKEITDLDTRLFDALSRQVVNFQDQVKQTGLSLNAALDVVGSQVLQTGKDLKSSLKNVVSANQALLDIGIRDKTGAIIKNVASRAVAQGRDPDDVEYTTEVAETVAREIKNGQLNLAAMEAQGMVSIEERTGAGLEDVARGRVGVAERTGSGLEQAALMRGEGEKAIAAQTGGARIGLAGRTGTERENLARRTSDALEAIQSRLGITREELTGQEGAGRVGLEEMKAGQRWQIGTEFPITAFNLGTGMSAYDQALTDQKIKNAGAGLGFAGGMVDYFAGERRAQPTTTQTSTQPTDMFGNILAGAGAGASIWGAYQQGGSLNKISDWITKRTTPT